MDDADTFPDESPSVDLSWGQERRMRFVDFRLQWDGKLNRRHLVETFNISVPQASNDISQYMKLWGERLVYDKSDRSYVAAVDFQPAYPTSGAQHYLAQLFAFERGIVDPAESILGFRPPVAVVPVPTRAADVGVLKKLVHAIEDGTRLDVSYQSITRDEPPKRSISPHAFAFDGLRWHVRAYCHLREAFRDFIVGRILEAGDAAASAVRPEQDIEWHKVLTLVLAPHPELPAAQRCGIEIDYKMGESRCTLECRQAMLYYVLRSLNLDEHGQPVPGIKQVIIENLSELTAYLPKPGQL